MSSTYTANPDGATNTYTMLDDGDEPAAELWRNPEERLADGVAYARLRTLTAATLRLRRVATEGFSITDTAESMAAVQSAATTQLLAIKTAQALAVSAIDSILQQGVPSDITSLVTDAATDGTNIIVIGTGGNRSSLSVDDGATWAAGSSGTASAGTSSRIIWSEANGLFYGAPSTLGGGFESIKRTVDGTGYSAANTTIAVGATFAGLAALANAKIIACYDQSGDPSFQVSAGGSGAFTATGGTVANSTLTDEGGCLVGNGGTLVYHAARLSSGSLLQVSSSLDGATWTTLATINAPTTLGFASRPRIFMCQNTGLLVIVAPLTSTADAVYSSTDGVDWIGPAYVYPGPGIDAYALAGGRLLCTRDGMLFATDGIGGF